MEPQSGQLEAAAQLPIVVGVDTGGTFTDIFSADGTVLKVASIPANPVSAIMRGLRSIGLGSDHAVAHGTTVATNAILERKGARTALITTHGFEDVLEIRRQNRPALYDLQARWPEPLVPRERRFGAIERLDFEGHVLEPLDQQRLSDLMARLQAAPVESIAVCLLFSYVTPDHERAIRDTLSSTLGALPLSLSHEIAPQYGEYERTSTTVANAYVMPVMRRYLQALAQELQMAGVRRVHVMHSNGGLVGSRTVADRPVQTILSGPAAGVIGAQAVARLADRDRIITLDMGGTSTDVAVVPGELLERDDGEVASFPLLVPMLTIETVGAGGGSIARVDAAGGLHVGPESAGADPGPAAYGVGDRPTVTDANLVLGRLSPRGLLGGEIPLDEERARQALRTVAVPLGLTIEQAAWSVIRLANSNMERAIRTVTLQRGYDPRQFSLVPFGGAGPLHGAELAEDLGIAQLLVPPHPGVMAALGLTVPDLRRDFWQTVLLPLTQGMESRLEDAFGELQLKARAQLDREELQGFGEPELLRVADVRYIGQSFELRVPYLPSIERVREAFDRAHEERYGYSQVEQPVEVVNVRVRATAPRLAQPKMVPNWPEPSQSPERREVWFGSSPNVGGLRTMPTLVLWRPSLPVATSVQGPAILEQYDSATLIPPLWTATVDDHFNLLLSRTPE